MTTFELIDRVLSKLGEPSPVAGPEIEGILPIALRSFALMTAAGPNRELLRKDFTVTITAGVGDLDASLTDAEPLLLEAIANAEIYSTGGTTPWQFLPDRTQLGLVRPALFIYYTVEKSNLRTRNTDSSLTSLSTTATVTASYVPTLTNVPSSIEDLLVDVVIRTLLPGTVNG
jgi:hypothetical protein